jgi:hypothetical protein
MQKWRQWEAAPHSEWSVAVEREAVIRPLAEMDHLTRTAVQQAVDSLGLSRTSIYTLVRRYKQRPQTDFVRTEGKSMKPVMMADLASTWG